jgi:APA family basic amino acid/polyamine antiporter
MSSRSPPGPAAPLRRDLGPFDATCVVIGAIIGVGIFFTPSRVAALAGSSEMALWAWTIGGVIALLGAFTFAGLGAIDPRSGGQYLILRDAFGPLPAFLFVFCNATAIQAGAAAIIAVVCVNHLATLLAGSAPGWPATLGLALLLIAGLTAANVVGVRWGARIQNTTVVLKLLTLAVVVAAAALTPPAASSVVAPSEARPGGLSPLAGLGAALVPTLFAYGGWQHALWIGGEVRRPDRNVPLAILVGVGVVVLAYLAVNWAYLHLLGFQDVARSSALAADATGRAWPALGERAVAGAVALSALGVLNAQLLSGPRLLYGMARDGRFFAVFARTHARFATPAPAIMLLGLLAAALLVCAGRSAIDRLLTGVVFIDGVFFALTALALPILRRRLPAGPGSRRAALSMAAALAFTAGETVVIVGAALDPEVRGAALLAGAWIGAALLCYLGLFRRPRPGGAASEAR